MKILLANPPTLDNKDYIREGRCTQEKGVWSVVWPPVTLTTSAAMLKSGGHEVHVLDCSADGTTRQQFLDKVEACHYDLIGWSTGTPTIFDDLKLADEIKLRLPSALTVVFGTHVTTLPDDCLKTFDGIDFIIRNEPESTLMELVSALSNHKPLEALKGISYKSHSRGIVHNPPREFIPDLDALPLPAWELLDLNNYIIPFTGEKFVIISPVRGCPFKCKYCTSQSYYGSLLRKRSLSSLINEITHVQKEHGIKNFFVWADTFTADKKFVSDFSQLLIRRGIKIKWMCNSRVDTIDKATLSLMNKAGCWMISFGIESGDDTILHNSRKSITVAQSLQAVQNAQSVGMTVIGHFMFGLPGETQETLNKTLRLALKSKVDLAQFYCTVPFPGSDLYREKVSEGQIYTLDQFTMFRQNTSLIGTNGLSAESIEKFRKFSYRRFYLRPLTLMRVLKIYNLKGLKHLIKTMTSFATLSF